MEMAIEGISVPDSKLAREITELVRDTEPPLLFHHSSRVFYWGALTGVRRGLKFDADLLYAGAMFHDMGLTPRYSSPNERFEVDSANAARDFLRGHGISQQDIDTVWTAIALHTTPDIPPHMHPVIALVTAGVEMDVLGIAYSEFSEAERDAVVTGYVTFWLGSVLIESSHVTKNPCDPARCRVFTLAIVEPRAARHISLSQNGVFLSRNLGGHK
jgi:hypothetical protein